MKLIRKLLHVLFINSKSKIYIEIRRNEPCFCLSGKKYKNCHLMVLDKKGKLGLWEKDIKTGEKKVKIYSKRKFKGISSKQPTGLRGSDIKATNIALNDYNPNVHEIYKYQ